MRRQQWRRSLNRHILVCQAIILVALAGVCIFIDPQSWPLAGFVFGVYVFKSELFGQLRNMLRRNHRAGVPPLREGKALPRFAAVLRWSNHLERDPTPPSFLQTIYRGFPPIPVYIPTEIPPHVLERYQPDHPTEAEQKARRLLWSMLDPDQRLQYSRNIKFIVDLPPPYRRMLNYAILGDGFVWWPDGSRQCVHPRQVVVGNRLPITDSVIAQLIHLRNDPGVLHRSR